MIIPIFLKPKKKNYQRQLILQSIVPFIGVLINEHLEMNAIKKFLSITNKISITIFIWCLSYMGYESGKIILSVIMLLWSFAVIAILWKKYKNKPFGNKVMDIFVITMCISGFADSEEITFAGVITFITAFIDLAFFLFLDYCDIKRFNRLNRDKS